MKFKSPVFAVLSLILVGCVSTSTQDKQISQTPSKQYCDEYVGYFMCVQDTDEDGAVDLMYFTDTMDIFMIKSAYNGREYAGLIYHPCVQLMDQAMENISSELLYVNDQTSSIRKTAIRSRLMMNYMRYYTKINTCHNPELAEGDDFGDEDFEDL